MKRISLMFAIFLMSFTLAFSQHGTPQVPSHVQSYNSLSGIRQDQRKAAFENAEKRKKIIIVSSIGVIVISIAIILLKRKKKRRVVNENKSTSVLDMYERD
jgi:hypothetical protein